VAVEYVNIEPSFLIQGCSDMTGTNCDLFTHNQSQSYLNHLVCGNQTRSNISVILGDEVEKHK
jgi:hypothetical protein